MCFISNNRAWLLVWCHLAVLGAWFTIEPQVFGKTERVPENYLMNIWSTEDNLPSSTVTAIAQTPDGYLWVGTYEGLARFDGVRFVTFDSSTTPELSHTRIQGLYLDARGTLWINTFRGGLTSYDGTFHKEWPDYPLFDFRTTMITSTSNSISFVTQSGDVLQRSLTDPAAAWNVLTPPPNTRPYSSCVDREGTMWFLTRDRHIVRIVHNKFESLSDDSGLAGKRVTALAADNEGRIWAGAENEIARWSGSRFEDLTPTNSDGLRPLNPQMLLPTSKDTLWVLDGDRLREESGRQWIAEIPEWRGLLGPASGRTMGAHEDSAGGVWFNHYGNGVFHITPDGHPQRFTVRNGLPSDRAGAWFQGRDGGIWVGVDRGGLIRLTERHFQVIGPDQGLPVPTALTVCQDPGGTVWIGTTGGGLSGWKDNQLTHYVVGSTASSNFVFSVFPQKEGGLWLSAGDGEDLFQFHDGQMQRAPWELHGAKSLLADRAGRLWAGTKSTLAWYSTTGRRSFGTNDGLGVSAVRALAEAPDGVVWAGADDGTLYRCETNRLRAYRPADFFGSHPILSLMADPDGTIWAGTFRGGLLRFKNGEFTRFWTKQGLSADVISQILDDEQGRIWLGTHQGICCVARSALENCASGRADTVDVVTYVDGLPSLECSDEYQPSCWHGSDDRLWFTTVKGAVAVDPRKISSRSLPPPVVIEELRVDDEAVPLDGKKIFVPPGHQQFEFRFTALSFAAPDRARFRYKMDGLDKDWENADTRRTAHYTHLPPNDYRFRIIACNSDGVWNTNGATLEFKVLPHFYETGWFMVFASVLVLGCVAAIVRTVATRKYRRELARLAQQHAIERDRARIAKDIHDDIGAGLTQITLLSELASREPKQTTTQLDRISDAARNLTRRMDEIVWAVDPQHDTLTGLVDYISAFAEDFLRTAGIRCRMDLPNTLPQMPVEAEFRYNLFLALKEALNNVIKHSHATEVWLRLRSDSNSFTLTVEDNGCGFSSTNGETRTATSDRLSSGSGLPNLKERLATIGGRCVIQSSPGHGTAVEMTVTTANGVTSPVVAIGADATHE